MPNTTQGSPVTIVGESVLDLPLPAEMPIGTEFFARLPGVVYVLTENPATGVRSWTLGGGTIQGFNIYADAVTGDDANPGTQALPVRTLLRAVALIPAYWEGIMRIWLVSPGTYSQPGDDVLILLPGRGGNPVYVSQNTQLLEIVGGFTDAAGGPQTVTASGPGSGEVTAAGLPGAPDTYAGDRIRTLSGASPGATSLICENDPGGVVTVQDGAVASSLGPGDTFVIERPDRVIGGLLTVSGSGIFCMVGVAAMGPAAFFVQNAIAFLEACTFDLMGQVLGTVQAEHVVARSLAQIDPDPPAVCGPPGNNTGIFVRNGGFAQLYFSAFEGSVVARVVDVQMAEDAVMLVNGFDAPDATVFLDQAGVMATVTGLNGTRARAGRIVALRGSDVRLNQIDVVPPNGDAIIGDIHAVFDLNDVIATGVERGLRISRGCYAKLTAGTITGGIADVRVDGVDMNQAAAAAGFSGPVFSRTDDGSAL